MLVQYAVRQQTERNYNYAVVLCAILTCWNACNYCSMLHAAVAHETTPLLARFTAASEIVDSVIMCI